MRPPHRPAAVVGACAAVLVLAVGAAATSGSWSLEKRNYGSFNFQLGGDMPSIPPMPTVSRGDDDGSGGSGGGLGIDGRWFLALFAVLAAAAIGVVLWRLWARFRATAAPPEAVAVAGAGGLLAGDPEPELPPLLAAAEVALTALSGDGGDDAIVAAWVAVEQGAARSGVRRHPAQTATEFTVAVLRRTPADPAAIASLRGLYLRARFSEQAVSGADLAEARRCVRALAAGWADAGLAAGDELPSAGTPR